MELDLSEDQELFRETTRKFLESECPLTTVRQWANDADGFQRSWWQQGAELGWTALLVPEEHGGGSISGEGLRDLVLVAEEMGRLASPGPLAPVNLVAYALATAGTDDQRGSVLQSLIAGETIGAWAFNEANKPSDAAAVAMSATVDGDGFVLNGVKIPVEAGAQAEQLLVTARTANGVTNFLVPSDTAGITVTALKTLDFTRRFAKVTFDNVKVPTSAVVGAVDGGAELVEKLVQIALVLQCAETVGATERVLEFTIEWAFDRYSFGRPLASYQALKHRFADMKMWLESSAGLTNWATRAVQAGADNAAELASSAKAYVSDRCPEIMQDCVQLHGGMGVTWEHDLHLYLRRATTHRGTYGGPIEHRERVAALAN
ncbi:MAG: acyl-CoA dehydrogenase family protein [Acidimicrobiia bacterium]